MKRTNIRVYPSYLWHFTTLHPVLNVIPSSPLLVFVISVGIQTNKVRRSICLPCWLKFRESSSKDKKWANVCKDQCLLETLEHSTKIRNCALNIKRIFSMVRIPHWWRQMKRREIEFSAQSAKSGGVGKVQSQTCISFQMQGMNRLVEKYESEIFLFCFSTQNKDRSSESKFSFKIFQKKSFQVFPYIKFVCHQTK